VQNALGHSYPGTSEDRLFEPTYHHKHHSSPECRKCSKNKFCKKAQEAACEDLQCDKRGLILRSRRATKTGNIQCTKETTYEPPGIHFGLIASGDTIMRSGEDRDRLAAREQVIAFEMEGAGICDNLPCLVIKGVCDYADSHKNKVWQNYAAATAAACMKSLLEQWAVTDTVYSTSLITEGMTFSLFITILSEHFRSPVSREVLRIVL
jgi:hypothetical protein